MILKEITKEAEECGTYHRNGKKWGDEKCHRFVNFMPNCFRNIRYFIRKIYFSSEEDGGIQ